VLLGCHRLCGDQDIVVDCQGRSHIRLITHHIKRVAGLLKVDTERTHHCANLFIGENG
jgi:hypothetical protein